MNKKIIVSIFTVIVFMVPGYSQAQSNEQSNRLTIPGSGACERALQELASTFNADNPGIEVVIPTSTGTSGGIKAVSSETHRLGRVGRPPHGDELKSGLTFLPIAYDAVVFVVGNQVGIDNFTVSQLADIFSGRITNWQTFGGPRKPIRVLIRQFDETSMECIRRNLLLFRDIVFNDQAKMAYHDYEMVNLLNKYPTSIGFLTNASVAISGNQLHAVGINSVFPTTENLISGVYPMKTTLGLVYKKERLNELSSQFIDFIFSAKGKQIIENLGLFPITRDK